MGIKLPLTKKKGGDKVADNPPPVFNKHSGGEELLKGHKNELRASSSHERLSNKQLLASNSSNGSSTTNINSNNSNSSNKPSSNKQLSAKQLPPLPPKSHPETASVGSAGTSGHSTSSTALWVAASNAAAASAAKSKKPVRRASDHGATASRRFSEGSSKTSSNPGEEDEDEEFLEEEFFEEEVIDEESFEEEEVLDELPPRVITLRFDEFDEMQTVLHINDYTKHEISRSWYKRDDYDKMVALARKTAEKVEERTRELGRKIDKAVKKKIEYRGLEAWTSMGAAKVKILKESAVEAVWNEQSRQWDEGINDVDRIREVYQVVSRGAQQTAQDRGFSDELIAKRIRQIEQEEAEKKQRRRLLGKSKALLGKSVKVTAGGVVKTAKLGVKTTKLTGKVALATTKVATKTAVATATLDRKMLKEAIIPAKKKRECEKQVIRLPSQALSTKEPESDGTIRTTIHHIMFCSVCMQVSNNPFAFVHCMFSTFGI